MIDSVQVEPLLKKMPENVLTVNHLRYITGVTVVQDGKCGLYFREVQEQSVKTVYVPIVTYGNAIICFQIHQSQPIFGNIIHAAKVLCDIQNFLHLVQRTF